MWKGLATTELYEEFLRNGLCAEHSKEFILASKNADVVELRTELQRKALLFIRLRMFDPIVFKRPCVSSKLMDLLSREEDVPKRENGNLDDFIEKFTLFDSVLVFIICYFSRICCIGALFLRKTKLEVNPDVPLIGILQNVLEKKHLLESEINVLFPLLQKNFSDLDPDQIRLTYVATLLFIRSYIRRKTLKFVTDQLAAELKMSTECQELNLMGNEAYKKEQYKAAIELYDSALSKNPYSYMILSNRAQAYKKLGKYKEAQLDCYIAVAINPTWCLGYCKLSSSLYCQQLYDQAFYVAEYGLSKCKNNQSKDYETLESLKLEASFKKSPTKTIKENTSKSMLSKKNISDKTSSNEKEIKKEKDSPEHLENAQNHSSSIQKELQKETKISEKNVPDKTSPGEKEIKKEKDTPEHLKNIPDKTSSNEKEIKKEKDSPEHLENAQNLSASSQKELQKETEISENMHHGVSEEKECREEATTEKAKIGNSSSTPKKADEFQKIPNENVRIGIDSSVLKKADEFQEIPDENVEQEKDPPSSEINHGETREKTESANEEKKAVNPSEENLTQLSPQKDVPPLLEAPESDDSYSEAAPPLMEAPESDNSDSEAAPPLMEAPESEDSNSEEVPPLLEAPSESDDSYYEDEAEFESPPNEIIQEETALECNAGRQGHESNLEQNIEKAAPPLMEAPESEDSDPELKPDAVSKASGFTTQNPSQIQDKSCGTSDELFQKLEPDTVSKASGVTSQSPSEIQDKSCGTSDELFQEVEKRISLLTESLTSKVIHIESAVTPCSESTSSVSEVSETTLTSSQNQENPCETSDKLHDIKMTTDKDTEEEKPKDINITKNETTVTTNVQDEKKLKIVDSKEEVKPMTDVREKSNKKNDKKLNTVQAQNSTSSFKKKSTPPKAVDGNIENKKAKVHSLLKDGSEVLVNGCGYLSSRYFQEALCLIKESPQIYGFQECDIVCIKYAYATAFYSSGEYSDLLKSIEILQEIYQEHENVSFPIVYYGLAMAFLKLNRFKDSLRFAKMVQDFLNKGFRLKVYTWPGLTTPIPETKAEILKKYIKDLIEECENPPKPVAVCRLENCSQPHIYYSDPDFKGFICISCSEQCSLQYHVPCWRTMKTDLSLSDKDFLSKNCLTPDCSGSIAEVKNIDKQGNIGKVFAISESKKPQKQKKSKLEKKSDAKEEKRKRRRHSSSICESISSASEAPSHEDLNPSNSSSKLSQNETETEVSSSAHVEDLDNPEAVSVSSRSLSEERTNNKTWKMSCAATEKNSDLPQISPSAVRNVKTTLTTTTNEPRVEIAGCATEVSSNSLTQQSTFYTDADPFHGAKGNAPPDNSKNAEIMITKSRPVSKFKGKTLKWYEFAEKSFVGSDAAETSNKMNSYVPNEIHSRVPNVVYSRVPNEADSIVPNATNSRVQYSDAFWSTHEAEDFPPLPASENSSHYAVECQSLNKDVSTPPDYLEEVLEKNIFTYLEDFLSFHGPLKIDDPILIEALSEFPTQANVLIADCGGISEFLKKNIHFAVVGESYVCVVKDIGSAYNLVSRRSLAQESDCHDLLNTVCDFSNGTAVKNSNFPTYLNPDAMEYQPFYPTGTKCGDYAQNDVSRKASEHDSESLMSVISRLRQPLCVDEDNVVMNSSCDNVSTLDAQSLNSDISRTAQVATRPHPKKVVTTKCANASAIVSDVDGVAEEEVVLNGTLGEGSISDEVVKEGISSEIVKERISTGTAQKVLSDETVERSIPKETVLGRIFSNSVEDGISEGKVEENIYDKTVHVKNLEETVMERNLEKTTRERNLKERVQKKGLREVVQGILEEEKNFEGAVQERISNETMQLGISDGTVLKISQKLTNEAISNAAIKDSALRTALSETLNTALVRALLRASDEENDIQNEKMGNVCIGAMENKAPCKSMKVSENSFQNQILVKENQNCGHRIPETVAKASQTENAQQGTMVSKGTMKTDESLDRMKEIIGLLQDKERVSLEKYKLMEIKYKACLEEMRKRDANFKSRIECAENELYACKLASEELHKKNVENEKLRNEVESLQMSLNKANEVNAIAKKEIEKVHLDLQELEKNHIDIKNWQDNMTKSLLESREDSKSLHETLLKTEERCKKVSVESEEKCKKLAEKLAESEEKCKRTNEKLQLLEKKEISLRTESQAAFEHLNELVASLTNEKFESIKRAVKAELSVLQLKKAEVLNRIDLKIAEANQKVKELKEGMSLIPLDPVNTKNIEALISQIDNQYVKDLCAIRDDYGAKIDKHIKEVESGTPLEKLKIDEVENLPEIPQVTVPSPIFNPTATYTAANVSVDPAYLKMASAFAPVTMPPTLLPIGATNSIASVPIAPNVPTNIAAAVPEAAAPAPTLKKLPPGISSSYVNLPKSIPSRSLASEAVHELNSLVQLSETSKSESTKPKIISTDSLSSSSSAEGKAAAKFSDSSLELGYSIKGNSAGKGSSVPQGKNSYEKLLIRLVEKFPNYTQVQLMSYIREFREKRQGKLSGLTLDAIVTQVGALIQSKQSAAKIESSKVPEVVPKFRAVQNKVSGKKLITDLKAREPPVEVPPIKKGNPWGSGAGESSKKWSGDTLEECAICCEEFANENAAYKVDCGHCFHLECIREWLNKKSDCPICRVHLLLPEDYPSLS